VIRLSSENRNAGLRDRGGSVILRRKILRSPAHTRTQVAECFNQHGGLHRHVEPVMHAGGGLLAAYFARIAINPGICFSAIKSPFARSPPDFCLRLCSPLSLSFVSLSYHKIFLQGYRRFTQIIGGLEPVV
jgi:hypothetical protein